MRKLFSKTLIAQSFNHQCSSKFSTAPQTSTSPPEIQSISSVTSPAKKKRGSTLLWFLGGLITYGMAETKKFIHREKTMKQLACRQLLLGLEPIELIRAKDTDSLGFRRVVCKGVFDEKSSVYVGPKPRSMAKGSEKGFYVVTPLLPIPNEPNSVKSPILVNRGWVPLNWKERSLESTDIDAGAKAPPRANKLVSPQQNPLSKFLSIFNKRIIAEEQVTRVNHEELVGIVRNSEIPGIFVLPNDPSSGKWFFVDVPQLAQAMGFGEDTIFVEKTSKAIDESRPYPALRNVDDLIRSKGVLMDNYFYAFLWHCLSVACFAKSGTSFMRK